MKRKSVFFLALSITLILASCASNAMKIDPKTLFTPLAKGDKPEFQISEGVSEANNPFVKDSKLEKTLSRFVPIFKDPHFNREGLPNFEVGGTDKEYTLINADSFHKASVAEVYTWLVDHLGDAGLRLATKEEIGNNADPLVYIEAEGTAYIWAFADGQKINIAVFSLRAYPGWLKVTYSGTRKIRL